MPKAVAQHIPWSALVLLGVLYLFSCALSAVLLYAIARTAIHKATPQNLDKVVRAIATLRMPLPRVWPHSSDEHESAKEVP